jgi:hypothetical protein
MRFLRIWIPNTGFFLRTNLLNIMGVSCGFISPPTRNVTVCKQQEKLVHDAHCETNNVKLKERSHENYYWFKRPFYYNEKISKR